MARIPPADPGKLSAATRDLLGTVEAEWGMIPKSIQTLAQAPAALKAYLAMNEALDGGTLGADLREQIALAVAQLNQCEYCLAAHTAVAATLGLSRQDVTDARRGTSPESRVRAALQFVARLVECRGCVTDADVAAVREAGFSNQQIVEIVANVALHLFTNYFNHVADTPLDFPRAATVAGS